MKRIKLPLLLAFCSMLVVAFALVGCNSINEPPETNLEPEAVDKPYNEAKSFSKKTFYALIVGNDSRNGTHDEGKGTHGADGHQRSDVMMLVRVDPKNHQISLVSIPRDTQSMIDGEIVKINESYNRGGIEASVAKVEEYTGVNIKYYFDVSFAEFVDLIDALGGLDINVMQTITFPNVMDGNELTVQEGDQHLNGREALVLARVRKAYQYGDGTRQYNDRRIIIELVNKAINNPEKLEQYRKDFMSIVHTNMSDAELAFYTNEFAENAKDVKFVSATFPIEGDIDDRAHDPQNGEALWLAWYNPDTWKAIMDVVKEGGDPNSVYSAPIG